MIRCVMLIFMIMIGMTSLSAQDVKGIVKDVSSRLPIANAQIITNSATILTTAEGRFAVSDVKVGSRLAVRIMGYETVEITLHKLTDTLLVYLKQDAIALREVEIKTRRNFKLDSLAIRKEYAHAFSYKGPSISDMFIERDINYDSPFGFTNPRSTASLVSLNVLQALKMFGKKQVQTTRLKQTIIRDEELNYIDNVFSKDKIRSLTGLEGDQLLQFMNRYRPSSLQLKKMTGYELTIYIKKVMKSLLSLSNKKNLAASKACEGYF